MKKSRNIRTFLTFLLLIIVLMIGAYDLFFSDKLMIDHIPDEHSPVKLQPLPEEHRNSLYKRN